MNFFPQRPAFHPMIYAYSDVTYPGCLKVGFTAVDEDKCVESCLKWKTKICFSGIILQFDV